MKVFQDFDRPAPQSSYEVAGRLLFIESPDLRLAKLIEKLFAGWLLTPFSFSGQRPDIKIRFSCDEYLPEIPRHLDQFEIAAGGRCFTDDDAYYLDLPNSLMLIQQADAVEVELWIKKLPESPDAALARATSFAVCAGLRRCGLFELHSAGVVDPNGEQGVLIIGPSGSGKSTLTLQLVTAGWGYLSDDELLLSLVGNEVEARGFRSFFAVSEATAVASGIGNLGNSTAHVESTAALKTCFEPGSLFPLHISRVVPGLLLFTAIGFEKETRVKELTQSEAMMRLIRACPWATHDKAIAGLNLDLLSRLARQTRAFDLMAGSDLLQPGRASNLLAPYTRLN